MYTERKRGKKSRKFIFYFLIFLFLRLKSLGKFFYSFITLQNNKQITTTTTTITTLYKYYYWIGLEWSIYQYSKMIIGNKQYRNRNRNYTREALNRVNF